MFDSQTRVLVIAAHPDDDILGCGGTLARFVRHGSAVRVVFLGEGISARFHPSDFNNDDFSLATSIRTSSSRQSLESIGISDIYFGDSFCVRFDTYPFIDFVKTVESHILDFNPDVIFTHSRSEVNIDHKITLDAVEAACRPVRKECPSHIFSFEIVCSGSWTFNKSFIPNLFVDITKFWDLKLLAWSFFVDESRSFPFPRSNMGLETLAKYRGMMCGVNYAESFQVQRSLY